MIKRALVIGATGFVGRHLVKALRDSEFEVVAMRRWDSDPGWVATLEVETVVGDLLDRERLVEILPGFNCVFMVAAPRLGGAGSVYLRESVQGIRNLLAVCRAVDVERVVVTSCATTIARAPGDGTSSADEVYLPGSGLGAGLGAPPFRAHLLSALEEQVEAQHAVEMECLRQAADGMDLILLCPGICVGMGAKLPTRDMLAAVPDEARINVVDIDAVVRAHLAAATERTRQPFGGDRRSLGGDNTTIGDLYKRLEPRGAGERNLGRYTVILSDEAHEVRALALFGANTWLDSTRAKDEFGFRPRSI